MRSRRSTRYGKLFLTRKEAKAQEAEAAAPGTVDGDGGHGKVSGEGGEVECARVSEGLTDFVCVQEEEEQISGANFGAENVEVAGLTFTCMCRCKCSKP